ncbi:MAG: hypothetical protein K940chlam2_00761 [Chlamydiae bacterium]|nr:hypothetical protein [Chlamydiota bacterium]
MRPLYIPKGFQKLKFCQSQSPRFASAEAAPIRMDRGDTGRGKDWNSGEGKNQFLKSFRYNSIPAANSPFFVETSSSTSSLRAGLRNQRNFRLIKFQIFIRKQLCNGLIMKPWLLFLFIFLPLALRADDLGDDINNFAFALSDEVREELKGNVTISPLAIFNNLSMLWIGASGETKQQIKNALHLSTTDQAAFLNAAQKLRQSLTGSSQAYELQAANGLFANKGTTFSPNFLHAIRDGFDAKVQALDFSQPKSALAEINKWVAAKTHDKIPTLLKAGDITDKTRMVLTSALYFKGDWAYPFNPKNTKTAPFHPDSKSTVEVPTMHQVGEFEFVDEHNLSLLWLPFKRSSSGEPLLECVIVLPKADDQEGICFSYAEFTKWNDQRKKALVSLALPKFCYSTRLDLESGLKALGMVDAFTYQADFSAMNQMHDLYLNGVFHEVFTSLNEKGVTASAATASTIGVTALPSPKEVIPFIVDRPFLFLIIDHHAKTILFMGHVKEPQLEICTR